MKFTIAIDGPAASGKSSAAGMVARALGFERVDSGLLYRAITYLLCRHFGSLEDVDLGSEEARKVVESLVIEQVKSRIITEEEDITDYLRTPEIDAQVVGVAQVLYIREKTHTIQRSMIDHNVPGVVIDGRDIGTVVLPDAFLKVFVTAKDTTRAKRRADQTGEPYEEVLEKLRTRDHGDITRAHGPLRRAVDAILVENDEMTLRETVDTIVKVFARRLEENAEEASGNCYWEKTLALAKKHLSL